MRHHRHFHESDADPEVRQFVDTEHPGARAVRDRRGQNASMLAPEMPQARGQAVIDYYQRGLLPYVPAATIQGIVGAPICATCAGSLSPQAQKPPSLAVSPWAAVALLVAGWWALSD